LNSAIIPLYNELFAEEKMHNNAKVGMSVSFQMLVNLLKEKHEL